MDIAVLLIGNKGCTGAGQEEGLGTDVQRKAVTQRSKSSDAGPESEEGRLMRLAGGVSGWPRLLRQRGDLQLSLGGLFEDLGGLLR
jgi:hypothetical protein